MFLFFINEECITSSKVCAATMHLALEEKIIIIFSKINRLWDSCRVVNGLNSFRGTSCPIFKFSPSAKFDKIKTNKTEYNRPYFELKKSINCLFCNLMNGKIHNNGEFISLFPIRFRILVLLFDILQVTNQFQTATLPNYFDFKKKKKKLER